MKALLALTLASTALSSCASAAAPAAETLVPLAQVLPGASVEIEAADTNLGALIAMAALERTQKNVVYDPSYRRLAFPNGDVPDDRGVCSDVVVRSLRRVGIDLQLLINGHMKSNFSAYPQIWGASRPDSNIDHRRVPNIEFYLTHHGARLAASQRAEDYQPGDIVAWNLKGDEGYLAHIGVVTDVIGSSGWPQIVHNIGAGPKLEDVLFMWPMTGHYRIEGTSVAQSARLE